jgi:succinate dehydrogenase / fumarate reductase cytochrome b subunit
MAKENFLTSSIGKKLIVGLTGLFLISFLVVHVGINSAILLNDNGETFNTAAHFMSHNWVIRVMEIGLLLGILIHIGTTLKLHFENKAKRPVGYAVIDGKANSKWYSRSMTLLGTLLLIFLVIHMADFWLHTKKALYITHEEENPYLQVKAAMQNPIVIGHLYCRFLLFRIPFIARFSKCFSNIRVESQKIYSYN